MQIVPFRSSALPGSRTAIDQTLEVVNQHETSAAGTLVVVGDSGQQLKQLRIAVPAFGLKRVSIAGLRVRGNGNVWWVPDTASQGFAVAMRRKTLETVSKKRIVTSEVLLVGAPGTDGAMSLPVSGRSAGVVEVVNSGSAGVVSIAALGSNGVTIRSTEFLLGEGATKALNAQDLLGKGISGSLLITGHGGAKVSAHIVQFRMNKDRRVIEAFAVNASVRRSGVSETGYVVARNERPELVVTNVAETNGAIVVSNESRTTSGAMLASAPVEFAVSGFGSKSIRLPQRRSGILSVQTSGAGSSWLIRRPVAGVVVVQELR